MRTWKQIHREQKLEARRFQRAKWHLRRTRTRAWCGRSVFEAYHIVSESQFNRVSPKSMKCKTCIKARAAAMSRRAARGWRSNRRK